MKKKDIIQLVKETIKEGKNTFYGNREMPSQLSTGTNVSVPTDEYPFSAKPKRTGTGMMETQGTLSSDMLNYADQYHMELVDTMKGVSTHPDKRTDGFYIKFPHENGPGPGALFGKGVRMQIEKSKAAAKAAAQKTVSKFQDSIEDYEISDSRSGVYGNVWLWIMPKTEHMGENKELSDNPKLQPGKTVIYSGTKYEVIENSGYVLTLQSLESGNKLKLNLGQLKDRPIKENNMKKNIKEADLYTLTSTDGEEKQVSFPDQNTAMAAASKNANVKQVVKLEHHDDEDFPGMSPQQTAYLDRLKETDPAAYKAVEDYIKAMNETKDPDDRRDDEDEETGWMGASDAREMQEQYIKERGDSNLMEHMDKYRKRATLMEGATEKLFKLFNAGKTDLEVRSHYLQMNVDMPESFIAKLRNNWESLRKTKLDLTLADKEAEGFEAIQQAVPANGMEGGEIDGMEEDKQLASGLFTK